MTAMTEGIVPFRTFLEGEGLRPFPIEGDGMEPTFGRGDFAWVKPVGRYIGEGVYVVEVLASRRAMTAPPRSGWCLTTRRISLGPSRRLQQHRAAKVVFKVNVIDHGLVPNALRF
jgi:hypothetical protein